MKEGEEKEREGEKGGRKQVCAYMLSGVKAQTWKKKKKKKRWELE